MQAFSLIVYVSGYWPAQGSHFETKTTNYKPKPLELLSSAIHGYAEENSNEWHPAHWFLYT